MQGLTTPFYEFLFVLLVVVLAIILLMNAQNSRNNVAFLTLVLSVQFQLMETSHHSRKTSFEEKKVNEIWVY